MSKICILGNSGSGKSYLAKKIGLSYPDSTLVFLDNVYFLPERNETGSLVRRSDDEKTQLIQSIKVNNNWIVEGVFGELIEKFIGQSDDVILLFLDIDWDICRQRIIQRPNNIEGVVDTPESISKLLKYGEGYFTRTDKRSHSGHLDIFDSYKGSKLRITSEEECNKLLQLLESTKDLLQSIRELTISNTNNSNHDIERNVNLTNSDSTSKLDRTTYTKKGYRPMRSHHIENLIAAESALGRHLDEIDEVSVGCVVVYLDTTGPQILVITKAGIYALPKGHVNIGEEEVIGAIRETNEETGTSLTTDNIILGADRQPVQVAHGYSFVAKLHKDHWERHANYPDDTLRPMVINHKLVRSFLAVVGDQKLNETIGEDAANMPKWYPVREVIDLLTYEEDKKVVTTILAHANISI
jgi:adenylate kinase family enzyme/ADP-ribose pyrophosphatase YjhB (NUDIX family)